MGFLTEAVGISSPDFVGWSLVGRGVAQDVIKYHIRAVHDINGPQCWLPDCKISDLYLRYVPPDEGHRTSRLRVTSVSRVPRVSATVYVTRSMAVDVDVIASEDDASHMVLKGDGK